MDEHVFPEDEMDPQEIALELAWDSLDEKPAKARRMLGNAIALDPFCLLAYELLADQEKHPAIAEVFTDTIIRLATIKYDEEFLKEHEGISLWELLEPRPFLRALYNKAEDMMSIEEYENAWKLMDMLLALDANDHQGVRYSALLLAVVVQKRQWFNQISNRYGGETTAFWQWTILLSTLVFAFPDKARKSAYRAAMKANPHVRPMLLSRKKVRNVPDAYALGSPEEARCYVDLAKSYWKKYPEAISWVRTADGLF